MNQTNEKKEPVLYAVYRSGIRVSDSVYYNKKDPSLISEKEYWEGILYRYPDGTKMEILPVRYKDRE